MDRSCKLCKEPIKGRSDKKFCSNKCKSDYHFKLSKVTDQATERIDKILHRNRSILLELLGKNTGEKTVARAILDQKKFHFTYITHYHLNSKGKMVNYVYDFCWIIFSDQQVFIKRVGRKLK